MRAERVRAGRGRGAGSSPTRTAPPTPRVTFCSHGQGPNGAIHQSLDGISWSTMPASQLNRQFTVGTDPAGNYIVFDSSSAIGFIAFPVTPGHYSMSFGPGITTQGTVTRMH